MLQKRSFHSFVIVIIQPAVSHYRDRAEKLKCQKRLENLNLRFRVSLLHLYDMLALVLCGILMIFEIYIFTCNF